MTPVPTAQHTRQRIIKAAFEEFYHHGFQGGSINRIVETAGITKGALFHHFKGKNDLGYAVLEEAIKPSIAKYWVDPLNQSVDPVEGMKDLVKERMKDEMLCMKELTHGCPLNNLAQEMSPLDETFRKSIESVYQMWRNAIRDAMARGMKTGLVRADAEPEHIASFLVASLAGIVGNAKTAQSFDLLKSCAIGLFAYLDSLKA